MSAGRKVSGEVFHILSTVPVTFEFSVPHLLDAVIKADATCGAEHAIDGFGKIITTSDIKKISTSLKDQAREVEGVIKRVRTLIKGIPRDCTVEVGVFEVNVVSRVFQQRKDTISDTEDKLIHEMSTGFAMKRQGCRNC